MIGICSTIKQALTEHLISQLSVSQVRDICIVTLPLQTLDDRWVDVYVEPRVNDYYLIHDGGKAVNELILQGLKVTPSIERELASIARRFGVTFSEEMFQSGSKIGDIGRVVNAVGMCSALGMTHLLATARAEEEPAGSQISKLLKQWAKKHPAHIDERVRVVGKLTQHEFDFTITSKKGVVIAISLLNPTAGALSAAQRFGFKAQDLRNSQAASWKSLAIESKSETWSQEAHKIVTLMADKVIQLHSGAPATYQELAEAIGPLAA